MVRFLILMLLGCTAPPDVAERNVTRWLNGEGRILGCYGTSTPTPATISCEVEDRDGTVILLLCDRGGCIREAR